MKLHVLVDEAANRRVLTTGAFVKGQFHCSECGYGVTVSRVLPRCPMCAGEEWRQSAWTPFTNATAAL